MDYYAIAAVLGQIKPSLSPLDVRHLCFGPWIANILNPSLSYCVPSHLSRQFEFHKLFVLNCLTAIMNWMADHSLQLNADSMTKYWSWLPITFCHPLSRTMVPYPHPFGPVYVIFYQSLNCDAHIRMLTRSCLFHWRNSQTVAWKEMKMLNTSFVSSRLDYSNSLFTSLNKSSLYHLQAIQNAAARLFTQSSRWSHITPI